MPGRYATIGKSIQGTYTPKSSTPWLKSTGKANLLEVFKLHFAYSYRITVFYTHFFHPVKHSMFSKHTLHIPGRFQAAWVYVPHKPVHKRSLYDITPVFTPYIHPVPVLHSIYPILIFAHRLFIRQFSQCMGYMPDESVHTHTGSR